MLKLKLGPHDNNGIIDTYNNGVSSPLSVLCRSSKVSGMLSFLRPLYNIYQLSGAHCVDQSIKREKNIRICQQNEIKATIKQSTYYTDYKDQMNLSLSNHCCCYRCYHLQFGYFILSVYL